jgi:hypothetical protein
MHWPVRSCVERIKYKQVSSCLSHVDLDDLKIFPAGLIGVCSLV